MIAWRILIHPNTTSLCIIHKIARIRNFYHCHVIQQESGVTGRSFWQDRRGSLAAEGHFGRIGGFFFLRKKRRKKRERWFIPSRSIQMKDDTLARSLIPDTWYLIHYKLKYHHYCNEVVDFWCRGVSSHSSSRTTRTSRRRKKLQVKMNGSLLTLKPSWSLKLTSLHQVLWKCERWGY